MKFERYENYINSDINWLAEIPEGWESKRNKSIYYEVSELSKTGDEILLTVSHITGVSPRSEKNVNMFFAESMVGYKLCKKEDLIINTMWAWMGALGTSNYEGICSPAYNVYRNYKFEKVNHQYIDYLMKLPSYIMEMTKFSKGIVSSRLRLYPTEFFKIESPIPSLEIQSQIVKYLNVKILKIDKEISILEQKIEKYKELKQTLIAETVLRGLNKNIELKDSEVEWIGNIPSHWEVKRLKDFIKFTIGGEVIDVSYWNDGTELTYTAGKNPVLSTFNNFPNRKRTKQNDILIARNGDGFIHVPKLNSIFTNVVQLVRLSKKVDTKFIFYSLENIKYQINKTSNGDFIASLNKEMWFNSFIGTPKYKEQVEIANYLDKKTSKIDSIVEVIGKKIEVLKEFRKTLINDVVTGKVKVA